ncbi:2-methoxy-6-polyprenyl-1,4-benzoquinol methylase, mitochondrial isoform X1 [Drosophila ficusphila]|uniref:2-methoxy-6-polyprenyl-1,4-benzoquinol methylase, mitochondrial isoform X1 n=1 Tax=Drosophila ficusphila TaxID=30025 RepID=UPI0007E85A9A|nr:2-methoxy-6-polyprenyl-1,4-benzoquinol methylase, mitochondrial isoform X1 [Drosophila ficusphila]
MQSTRSIRLLSLARRFAHIRTAAQSAQEPTGSGKDSSKATSGSEQTTHFGFQTVKESEKEQKVHEVFEQVANSYDMMNDAMSLGIHRVWKDIFVERLGPTHGMRLLDMAGGTGDITFRYLRYLANQPNPQQRASHVTVSDINQHMLDVGEERAKRLGLTTDRLPNSSIAWQCADAEKLPFKDESFTAYTIAFGIRNCTHVDKVKNRRITHNFSSTSGSFRGISSAAAGRSLHVPGVQPPDERDDAVAVRPVLLPSDPADGPAAGWPVAGVPVFGGEHPAVSQAGAVQADDRAGGLRAGVLREPHLRRREHSLRLQVVRSSRDLCCKPLRFTPLLSVHDSPC